jgi:serine O-acetyltransferase
MLDYIMSDMFRYTGRDRGPLCFLRLFARNRAFRWQVAFRLVHARGVARLVGSVLWCLTRGGDIKIPRETRIGYGLYIGHDGPVVVNGTAVLGDNCNLSQFVTIGSNEGQAATVGDEVYIGPGVCVVEAVRIGDRATIGAGAVVTKDIPAGATAVGNYARVINYDGPGRYIRNRWVSPRAR